MSTLKVDTIATRTGSGNITVSNNIVGGGTISGTNITASGTLGVTGNTTVGGTLVNTGLITASAGVAIGGTGAANTLDDYEEGTFTPVSNSGTLSSESGVYTKIGNVVRVLVVLLKYLVFHLLVLMIMQLEQELLLVGTQTDKEMLV